MAGAYSRGPQIFSQLHGPRYLGVPPVWAVRGAYSQGLKLFSHLQWRFSQLIQAPNFKIVIILQGHKSHHNAMTPQLQVTLTQTASDIK